MQYHFEILARDSAIKDILSDEIFYWINMSIEGLIKSIFGEDNTFLNKFEITQKTKDDIQSIVKKSNCTLASSTSTKYSFTLPSTYWFKVREECTISYKDCADVTKTTTTDVIEANMNNVNTILVDPFSEYILRYGIARPVRIEYGNKMELITDGNYSVTVYALYYIDKPTKVTHLTTCDLPSETHEDIVSMAYNLCIGNHARKNKVYKNKDLSNEGQ